MFDMSSGELLLIAVAALIFIKPKDLPSVLRAVGQWTGKIRRMAGEFQDQFREAMREAEMADLKKDIDEATGNLGAGFDPFKDIKEATEWKPTETATETATATPPSADAPPAPPAEAVVAEPPPAAADAAPPHAAAPAAPASGPTSAPTPAPPAGGDRAA
jgi:sec-independent protein translocase protein TatB